MKSAASVNGIAQETQKKKKNKISCRRPPRTQQEKGKKWKKIERGENQATQKRREHGLRRREAGWDGRKKRRRGIGGGVRECKWREAESKELRGVRFLGASKGRKAGHVGRGSILSGLEISRRARDLVAGEPPGEGAHVQGNASLPGFFFN